MDIAIPYSNNNPTKWVITGVLRVSGNDASAPKPWLNLKSSSDAGFVGSNAAVQTSVIVWYIYIYIYIVGYRRHWVHGI